MTADDRDSPAAAPGCLNRSTRRVLILEGRLAEAIELLERLAAWTASGQRNDRLIDVLTLQAIALQALGKEQSSVQALLKALVIAEPQGYVRMFLHEGAPIRASRAAARY